MADPRDPSDEPPRYTRHRSRPGLFGGRGDRREQDDVAALRDLRAREGGAPDAGDRPPATPGPRPRATPPASGPAPRRDADGRSIYRAGDDEGGRRRRPRPGLPRLPGRRVAKVGGTITAWWVAKLVLKLAVAWFAISIVAFLISATIHQSGDGGDALGGGGLPPFGTTNVLVLGSDARTKGTKEPGADSSGPSRSDTILLMRIGGGHNARLSIPRDTVVDIPGHGRTKINAAYAYGGPALAIQTVEQFTGIDVNHLIEVNFENFPDLIDAMGGVDYTGSCVVSRINGGYRNGGYTLRLKKGTTRIDGKQALALARTRHNDCNPREDDFTRARRQQKLLSAMKSRVVSPSGFFHGPFIGWNAPKAIKSDMSAPTLLGLFSALATSGSAPPHVLRTSPLTLPDGSSGQVASDASLRAAVRRFEDG